MVTVLQRGGLANDYGIPRILGYYIRNIISIDLTTKSDFFSWSKVISGGYVVMVTTLHKGVRPNDYSITWKGGIVNMIIS